MNKCDYLCLRRDIKVIEENMKPLIKVSDYQMEGTKYHMENHSSQGTDRKLKKHRLSHIMHFR